MKKYHVSMKSKIEEGIIAYLKSKKKALRKELFGPAIQIFEPSISELKNENSSDYLNAKSITGIIINEMISLNTIKYEGENLVYLDPKEVVDRKEILDFFYNKYLTKEEIKQKNLEQKNLIKSIVYNVITRNPQDNRTNAILKIQTEIDRSEKIKEKLFSYPTTPMGNLLREHKNNYLNYKTKKMAEDKYIESIKSTISRLFAIAEEYFEIFVYELITRVYNQEIISKRLTAGSTDNGIDCEFIIADACGFKERVIVQAKTKKQEGSNLSLKVLREYIGVLELTKADKCVIISNQNFNKTALTAAKSYPRVLLVGIDGLFELMKKTHYGLINGADIIKIDDKIFLID